LSKLVKEIRTDDEATAYIFVKKQMKLIAKAFFIFLLISCNNSNTSTEVNRVSQSKPDSIMHEIMEQHDKGMAKMSKLSQAKNKLQHVLDSLSNLPANLQNSSLQYRMQLDSAFNWLTYADRHMEAWMNEFNMDSLKDNKDEQVKYLESEKIKISQVNDEMSNSLKKTDSLLKKH
jgi:hypothetical protein